MGDAPLRREQLLVSQNNLAYHLATKSRPTNREEALKLVEEIRTAWGREPEYLETTAWVLARFSETYNDPEETRIFKEAIMLLSQLLSDPRVPSQTQTRIMAKFNGVFALRAEQLGIPMPTIK